MKQFLNILKFEFLSYLENKFFVWVTVGSVLIIGVVFFFPRFKESFLDRDPTGGSGNSVVYDSENKEVERKKILISANFPQDRELTASIFGSDMPEAELIFTDEEYDGLKSIIEKGEADLAVFYDGELQYSYIVKDTGMYDRTKYIVDEIMTKIYRMDTLAGLGVSGDQADKIFNILIEGNVVQVGKDQMKNFFYTYFLVLVLYVSILTYGQFVANGVAIEKSSRAMELLITSAKPVNLIFGKVFAACLAGLLQLLIVAFSVFVFFSINRIYWDTGIFDIPLTVVLYTVVFFVLGYFMYAFLYGVAGSLASKMEDISSLVQPITFLFVISFLIVMFSIGRGDLNSPLMIICSFVPFTSPIAMFARISMGDVMQIEIAASIIILIISAAFTGYLSAKIYKVGVLLYGNNPKFYDIFKYLK